MGKRERPRKISRRILPSVTSPKEEKASLSDFSSTDHDNPERTSESIKIKKEQNRRIYIYIYIERERERERERDLQQRAC